MPRLWDLSQTVSDRLKGELGLEAPVTWLPTTRLESLSGLVAWVKPARVAYGDLGQRSHREYEAVVMLACRLDDEAAQHQVVDLAETLADRFVHQRLSDSASPVCHEATVEVPDEEAYRQLRLYVLSVRLRFVVTVR